MAVTAEMMEKLKDLQEWTGRIGNMGGFLFPEELGLENTTNKYERFTGYFQKWVESLLRYREEDQEMIFKDDKAKKWDESIDAHSELGENWWSVAQKVGAGKQVENSLPTFNGGVSEEGKDLVYNTFLPVYRALKDSFSKRSVFQWIFNHRQYTAERDTLNAVRGLILTLSGETKEQLEARYAAHKEAIPTTNVNDLVKQERQKDFDEELDKVREEEQRKEREIEEDLQKQEELKRQEIEEISRKSQMEINNKDQTVILLEDENFKTSMVDEMKAMIPASCKMTDSLKKILIGTTLFSQVKGDLKSISERADIITGKVPKTEEDEMYDDVELTIDREVRSVFRKAWSVISAFKLDVKDRLVLAQKLTNHFLTKTTAVGFDTKNFGEYGKNYALSKDIEGVKEIIGSSKDLSLDKEQVDKVIQDAQKELSIVVNEKESISIPELAEKASMAHNQGKVEDLEKGAIVNQK